MNSLKPEAQGRTKADIASIRHPYLDRDAEAALSSLQSRQGTPEPNRILDTSRGKLQVVWKVERFTLADAESLQQGLAGEFGADPAATDAARVRRLPGFLNHKYEPPHTVGLRALSERSYQPSDFRNFRDRPRPLSLQRLPSPPKRANPGTSRSQNAIGRTPSASFGEAETPAPSQMTLPSFEKGRSLPRATTPSAQSSGRAKPAPPIAGPDR